MKHSTIFAIALPAILSTTSLLTAQQAQFRPLAPSQKASVMQTIGVTDVTIPSPRPAVKARTIFADAPPSMAERAKGEATLDNQNERKRSEEHTSELQSHSFISY